jgi:hypothetical protein
MTHEVRSEDAMAMLAVHDLHAAREHLRLERLRLFRRHLQLLVVRVSPLVRAAFSQECLPAILDRFMPLPSWPATGLTLPHAWKFRIERADPPHGVRQLGLTGRNPCARLLRNGGVIVRSLEDPLGMLGVKVVGHQLEFLAIQEGIVIATQGALVRVRLPMEVPETVRAGAAGLELDSVMRHPFTDGRGYAVRRMKPMHEATLLEAWTGSLPFRMPWPELGGWT